MPNREYTIWCDESLKKGWYYSNFYGGVLVSSQHKDAVIRTLTKAVHKARLTEEIKWQKVNDFQPESYISLMNVFFTLIKANKLKVRIMFTQNAVRPRNLTANHVDNEYFLLYYQFFKHIFGLRYCNEGKRPVFIRAYFDNLPETLSRRQQFKEYIKGLESWHHFSLAKVRIRKDDIAEVDSKDQLPLQFLDVVLGAMAFRLNDMHLEKLPGKKRRGKRTIAKEKLYKHINRKLRELRPGFNIGTSTGKASLSDNWDRPYRHWCFKLTTMRSTRAGSKNKGSDAAYINLPRTSWTFGKL